MSNPPSLDKRYILGIMTKQKRRWFWGSAVLVSLAALLYCSWPLGFWLNPIASRTGLASELGAFGQPYDWLFIGGDIVSGALLLTGCVLLHRLFGRYNWAKVCVWSLGIYGLAGAIDAALPLRCLPSVQACGPIWHDPLLILHGTVDIIGSIALIVTLVAAWLHIRKHDRTWLGWIYIIGGGGVVFAGLSLLFIVDHGPGYWAQRYYLTLSCIWVASIPFVLYRRHMVSSNKPSIKNIRSAARDLAR